MPFFEDSDKMYRETVYVTLNKADPGQTGIRRYGKTTLVIPAHRAGPLEVIGALPHRSAIHPASAEDALLLAAHMLNRYAAESGFEWVEVVEDRAYPAGWVTRPPQFKHGDIVPTAAATSSDQQGCRWIQTRPLIDDPYGVLLDPGDYSMVDCVKPHMLSRVRI